MEVEEMEEILRAIDFAKALPQRIEIAEERVILEKAPQEVSQRWLKFNREEIYKHWPVNPGTFDVKDAASPVAVVCPAQNSELQQAAISYGAAISGPCITPDRGVELVITNTISNPNIRWIILAGKDSGHLAGDVLWSLSKYGRDAKTRRVLNTKCRTNPYLLNLSDEVIERFRRQIKVINLLFGYKEEKAEKIKRELGLVIRACIQEPRNAVCLTDRRSGDKFYLFDPGTENLEPMVVDLNVSKIGAYFEGFHRVGTSIHVETIAEAYPVLMSHIINKGSLGMQESTRNAFSTIATQTIIHNVEKKLFPAGWRPEGWAQTDKDAQEFLEKYKTWIYLFPLSDVRYEQNEGICVPYVPETRDYIYGNRLTAYGYELADKEEQEQIRDLVEELHQRFRYKLPGFKDIIDFYDRLSQIQRKSFNQLYKTAKAAKLCVKEGFGNSYRLYMSLQIPSIDVTEDPRRSHNPCFALYEVYPRRINGEWQLDTVFVMRAHDILAFPANANGGIALQKFIANYAGIKPGFYVHHAEIEVCDYMFPEDIRKKFEQKREKV